MGRLRSSEVDPQCLRVLKENHTDILHIGDVRDLNTDIIASMGTVSFLCGGSPCNEVSRVNGGRRGLFDEEGDSNLFFHFVRILKQLQAAAVARESRFYFFFENTAHLDAVTLEAFTKYLVNRELGCKPIVRCAAHYSATKRKRLFWSNLPGFHDKELPMKNNRVLQDYIGPARKALVQVAKTFTTNRGGQRRSNGELQVEFEGQKEFLYAADQERLLGFPDGYTDKGGMSQTARSALLGRTWSVDVVMDLWTPLCEIFRGTG
ncbi:DNA (cytosine-5)-methyltransferase 3C-like [Frankliniella occidentalis]|uniref:DNA (cytosine-5-)-methyltransferase n=1 Tax=Frankliniella occidentalis TaxID=133901 RepID=A0A9C6X7Z3_FRAOC|nr:DNA (cytosine-5)-methyltransferase 3C-like [Frankliniella occidentalis]